MYMLHDVHKECIDCLAETENKLFKQLMSVGLKLYEKEFYKKENTLLRTSNRICKFCNAKMRLNGKDKAVSIQTIFGIAKIRLRRLRCKSCNKTITPAKHIIPVNKISAGVVEIVCKLAENLSYENASKTLKITNSIDIPTASLHKIVINEVKNIKDTLLEEMKLLFTAAVVPKTLVSEDKLLIAIDGGFVSIWHKKNSHTEVKAVTMSTGTKKIGKNGYELLNRIGYASNVNAETFGYLVATLAIKWGHLTAKHVVIISDGATWIHNIANDWFPDAIHVLDLFHLIKHIDETFGSKCTGVDKTTLDNAIKAVYAYDADKLLSIIVNWNCDTQRLNKKDELITYITNNSKQINNHKLVGLHGSGYIEKGVDLMISRRLKLRGMGWSKIGSEAILKLQVMKYNKQTSAYFAKRKGLL